MSAAGKRILVVDDDTPLRNQLCRALRRRGLDPQGAEDGEQALRIAREFGPQWALIDLRMPGMDGLILLQELLAVDAAMVVVVLTGYGSIANALEATRLGAGWYLSKPADADDVLAAFAHAEGRSVEEGETVAPSLARAEWEHISRVLADAEGNVSEAARRLGIHRRTLQRKLRKRPPRE